MVTEILSFYTPYTDVGRMKKALTRILQDEITAMEQTAQGFHVKLRNQEYLEIPFVTMDMDPKMFQTQIQKLYVSSAKLPCHDPFIKQNLLYQIALFRAAYVLTFNYEPNRRNEKILPLMEIADAMDALIFWETGDISDSYGDIILNKQGKCEITVFNPVDGFDITNKALGLSEHQMKRIHHSLSVLRYKGIYAPTNIAPPFDEEMAVCRSKEEIAKRAIACMLLGMYTNYLLSHQGNSLLAYESIENMIRLYQASPYFTIKEIEYLNDRMPKQEDVVMYQCYCECAYTMLWALGIAKTLYFPSAVCDNGMVVKSILAYDSTERLIKNAKLRDKGELLDALDLVQRYAWACQDAEKLGFLMPAGLLHDVVKMRHHTLSWIVSKHDVNWDHVKPQIQSLRLKGKL